MTTIIESDIAYVVASADVRHKTPAADDGFVGLTIKQQTPSSGGSVLRANLDLIVTGERYALQIEDLVEVSLGSLTPAKGDLLYINTTTNALAAAGGAGVVPFGKVQELSSDARGLPAGRARVNLNFKA